MATTSWFANSALLTVATSSGAAQTVAVLKGFEMTPKFEIVELYGMEKLTRAAVARHSQKVDVSCKYAAWDPAADQILTEFQAATTGNDKNKCGLFTIVATVKDVTNAHTLTMTAIDVYFDSVPFAFTENEFIVRDLKGTAADYTIVQS
jgi:hypothetical protein